MGKGGFPELVYWGQRVRSVKGDHETRFKLDGFKQLAAARDALLTGDPTWPQRLEKVLSSRHGLKTVVHWSCVDKFKSMMRSDPASAEAMLRKIWRGESPGEDPDGWLKRLVGPLDTLAVFGPGYRLQLLTTLICVEDPDAFFPYKQNTFRHAYRRTGYPTPQKGASAVDELAHAVAFIDRLRDVATQEGVKVRGRLEAHDLLWYALGHKSEPDWPGWSPEDVALHTAYRGKDSQSLADEMEKMLDSEAEELDDEYEEPDSEDDGRRRVSREILARRGQSKFRQQLLKVYGGRCAITGCNAAEALEAAHLEPYADGGTNTLANGLLLRADMHTLFDLGRVAVDPETYSVILHPDLRMGSYADLHGKIIELPSDPVRRPAKEALLKHLQQCRF